MDIVSRVVRWRQDKRRWYAASIKLRSDSKYSKRKMYKQKGTGLARHSTRAVSQFRGGYKYSAIKTIKRSKTNKKHVNIAIKSILMELIKKHKVLLVDKLINVRNLSEPCLLIHASNKIEWLVYATNIGFRCLH